jgi:HK97 family phage prohead protease
MAKQITTRAVSFVQATAEEVRALGEKPAGYVAGWASTDSLDSYTSIIEAGAFDKSIAARGLRGPKSVKFLCDHMWTRAAGVIHVLEQRAKGLWIEAQYNLNIQHAREQYEAAKMNEGFSFSVGFYIVNGQRDHKTGVYMIKEADLIEVSSVLFPANDDAEMVSVKSAGEDAEHETVAEFEKALVAAGIVESRNDARRITQVVKRNARLFHTADAAPVADDADSPPVPAEQPDPLAELAGLFADTRRALAAIAGTAPQKD